MSKIWYSLDGQTFNLYTSAVTIPYSSNPVTIQAFADDNAANRSGLVTKTFSFVSSIIPIAECVSSDATGRRAWFGYRNESSTAVTIAIGNNNFMMPPPTNKGQTTAFQPGTVTRAFSVRMTKKRLDWKVQSADNILRTATITLANTPTCQP